MQYFENFVNNYCSCNFTGEMSLAALDLVGVALAVLVPAGATDSL
jgi:hypothetical protein